MKDLQHSRGPEHDQTRSPNYDALKNPDSLSDVPHNGRQQSKNPGPPVQRAQENPQADLQRKEEDEVDKVQAKLEGGGQSLGGETKGNMEKAFGADFTGVKLHTGSKGNEVAQGQNARAVTVGQDISFANGEYKPGTMEGDALLAHELAHTEQQKDAAAVQKKEKGAGNEGAYEKEADDVAVGAAGKIWGKTESWGKEMGGKTKAGMKTGLRLQACGGGGTKPKKDNLKDTLKNKGKGADTLAVKKILDPNAVKLTLTEREKHNLIATIMAESSQGNDQAFKISWIYYNRIVEKDGDVDAGLTGSSAHDLKNTWWKAWMVAQGEKEYRDDPIDKNLRGKKYMKVIDPKTQKERDAVNVGDYVDNNGGFKSSVATRLSVVKNHVENVVLKTPEMNPYAGWTRQGYWGDLNQLSPKAKADVSWKWARQYFWLQKEGKVTEIYVEEMRAPGQITQFIFNEHKVEAYFKTHKLPDVVPLYDPNTGGKQK